MTRYRIFLGHFLKTTYTILFNECQEYASVPWRIGKRATERAKISYWRGNEKPCCGGQIREGSSSRIGQRKVKKSFVCGGIFGGIETIFLNEKQCFHKLIIAVSIPLPPQRQFRVVLASPKSNFKQTLTQIGQSSQGRHRR